MFPRFVIDKVERLNLNAPQRQCPRQEPRRVWRVGACWTGRACFPSLSVARPLYSVLRMFWTLISQQYHTTSVLTYLTTSTLTYLTTHVPYNEHSACESFTHPSSYSEFEYAPCFGHQLTPYLSLGSIREYKPSLFEGAGSVFSERSSAQ